MCFLWLSVPDIIIDLLKLHALALKPHSFTDHVMGNVTYIHDGMVECLLYRVVMWIK